MATGAADGFLRCGCMSSFDCVIERRPYHKNCGCALHEKKNDAGSGKSRAVSYPIRRTWSEGSLALMAGAQMSPVTSPVVAQMLIKGLMRRPGSCSSFPNDLEEERASD
ncbi:hypothetical protein SAY87_025592 [Trapa incisa]|uniref:Uncharacterized protein n=1 Tax=Trapa incisa TaxID=236973 RepID=A0AAN7GI84_9MYRT|nr:hypothetical protein SAY87_025592 [Trapa incisa]